MALRQNRTRNGKEKSGESRVLSTHGRVTTRYVTHTVNVVNYSLSNLANTNIIIIFANTSYLVRTNN